MHLGSLMRGHFPACMVRSNRSRGSVGLGDEIALSALILIAPRAWLAES